jgi:hypothetical protein
MPQIPVYRKQVGLSNTKIQTPDIRVQKTPDAYNVGIAKSVANLGQNIANFSQELQNYNQKKDTAIVLNKLNDAQLEWQENLYSSENKTTINIDGTQITQPRGILTRQSLSATNSLQDYETMSDEIKNKYSQDLNDNQKAIYNKLFEDKLFIPNREAVIKHQAKQLNEYADQQLNTSIDLSIDNIIKNPSNENIETQIKFNNGNIVQRYKEYGNDYIKLKILENTNKTIKSVVNSALDTNNYELAGNILEKQKDNMGGEVYADLKGKTDKIKQDNTQLEYSNNLIKKFGKETAPAIASINADKSLNAVQKQTQISNFNTQHNIWEQGINDNQNVVINNLYTSADNINKQSGLKGLSQALKQVDLSNLPVKERENTKDFITKQIFNIQDSQSGNDFEKTKLYFEIMKNIETGKVSKIEDLTKQYGGLFTKSDYTTFSSHINSFNKDIVGVNFSKITNDKLKKNNFDVNEQISYWASVNDALKMEMKKKGDNLTTQEKVKVSDDLLNKVIIQKKSLPLPLVPKAISDVLVPDYKDYRYKLPYYAKFNKELGLWTIKDKNGDDYQITEEDLKNNGN